MTALQRRILSWTCGVVAVVCLALALASCDSGPPAPQRIQSESLSYAGVRVVTDPETGCQYLIRGATGGMAARISDDGRSVLGCRNRRMP